MASLTRTSISDFSLVNPFYIGASVSAFTVVNGVKTATLATLYEATAGTATLANPQTLDSEGKWQQPVYIQDNVVLTVSGVSFDAHDTGIIQPPSSNGAFALDYFTGDGTTSLTPLSYAVDAAGGVLISVDDWILEPDVDYTADGTTTITLAAASVVGTTIWVAHIGTRNQLNYVADGSITAPKLTNNSTALAAIRTKLSLGTLALQDAGAVAITGGGLVDVTIGGTTIVAIANGGTGASTASTARSNLGLGSMALQAASNVTITGGSITGITDIAIADGGTGASTAASARTNLNVSALTTSNQFGGGQSAPPVTVAYAASVALDMDTGTNFDIGALTGNITLANPTNQVVGQSGRIRLTQDGTGSRILTLGTHFKTPGGAGIVLTTTASAKDVLYYDIVATNEILVTIFKAYS